MQFKSVSLHQHEMLIDWVDRFMPTRQLARLDVKSQFHVTYIHYIRRKKKFDKETHVQTISPDFKS